MDKKAKRELIEVILGVIMIIVGTSLFVNKARIESGFLGTDNSWSWWMRILVIVPLIAGIVLLVIKPKSFISKLIAFIGVLAIFIVIIIDSTVILERRMSILEFVIDMILIVAGIILIFSTLFMSGKRK